MICTIYTDASFNPSTDVAAVAFRARWGDQVFSGSRVIPHIRLHKQFCPGGKINANIDVLELFGVLFAMHRLRQHGVTPSVWFINTDNLNVAKLFWPWENRTPAGRIARFKRAIDKMAGNTPVRIKHVRAHQESVDARQWSNNHVDRLAKDARRAHERNNPCTSTIPPTPTRQS